MKIKYNNATMEYDVIDNGNVLFSSNDSLFGKKECEYYFLKEKLHIDESLVRAYGRYEVDYNNFDEVIGVDLFDSDGNHTKHIDSDEIESILNPVNTLNIETLKKNREELIERIDSIEKGTPSHYDYLNDTAVSDLQKQIKKIDLELNGGSVSVVFDGKNIDKVTSFFKENDIQFYQEDSGKLRALINKKMTTISKDDKICIDYKGDGRGFAQSIIKSELYGGLNGITLSDIRDITLQEKEDGDYEFLVSYSSQYSETPEYDTFNKETIQEMFKNMPQEEFSFNVVPYLEGEELEKMLDAVYPSKTDNISLQDGLKAIIVDGSEISIKTDEIRDYLLNEYHKAGVKNLQIDAVIGAIQDSLREAIDIKYFDKEIRISKNISIDCYAEGKVGVYIDRPELTTSKDFENVFSDSSSNIDNSFPNTDVITTSEKETVSIKDLKSIRSNIVEDRALSSQESIVLKNTNALQAYILNSNSHNISDLLDVVENNFGSEQKEAFLESFQRYTDDSIDSYYNSSVLLSVFSDNIASLSDELGENEELDNLYSKGL